MARGSRHRRRSSSDSSSDEFQSAGLTGAAFNAGAGGSSGGYQMVHSAGPNAGGISFSASGHVKVQIDGNYESFHRDDIAEHKRPGYYTVRRHGKKYNIKYNQFEIDDGPPPQVNVQQQSVVTTTTAMTKDIKPAEACSQNSAINFFPYYEVKMGKKIVTVPYSVLAAGKARGKHFKFEYNGVKQRVRCRHVQPVRKMYKCIVKGKMVDIPFNDISPHEDSSMFNVMYRGNTYTISSASVHAGDVIPGHDGVYDHKMLFPRSRQSKIKTSMMNPGGNLRMRTRKPRRRINDVPKLEIFDVSYCLCYLIVLNGSHIIMPHHRIKASVKHRGYLRFRYNKLVYYVTPQTVHQAFYAPVVGYYACLLDNKLLVISGMDIDKDPDQNDLYTVRYKDQVYRITAPNITFLGEFLLDSDNKFGPDGPCRGGSGSDSDSGSSTSDSEASVAGRDEIIRDADEYAITTTVIRRRRRTRCRRVRINGTEVLVPEDQVSMCSSPKGYTRVTYYGKTYFVPVSDLGPTEDDDCVGFYSVNIEGLPYIVTGLCIREHPRQPGKFIVRFGQYKYLVPKHGIMYLGDYPEGYAPDYCIGIDYNSDEECWLSGDSRDSDSSCDDQEVVQLSDEEPQECIIVRSTETTYTSHRSGGGDFPETMAARIEPGQCRTGKSIMGYKVTIGGESYTVSAGNVKIDPNMPGFMEVKINGKRHRVHMSSCQSLDVPIVYFITINNDVQVIPARNVRRDPDFEGYLLVTFKGSEHQIPIGACRLMDGRFATYEDIPDADAPIFGGEFIAGGGSGEVNWIKPDGAPAGGYFGPDGIYYGPDGIPYGRGTRAPYKRPPGAPEGGYFSSDGLYYGPDGQCYGPGIPFGPEDWASFGPGGAIVELPRKCSKWCILNGGHIMRRQRLRSQGYPSDDDSSHSSSTSSKSSSSSSHSSRRRQGGSHRVEYRETIRYEDDFDDGDIIDGDNAFGALNGSSAAGKGGRNGMMVGPGGHRRGNRMETTDYDQENIQVETRKVQYLGGPGTEFNGKYDGGNSSGTGSGSGSRGRWGYGAGGEQVVGSGTRDVVVTSTSHRSGGGPAPQHGGGNGPHRGGQGYTEFSGGQHGGSYMEFSGGHGGGGRKQRQYRY